MISSTNSNQPGRVFSTNPYWLLLSQYLNPQRRRVALMAILLLAGIAFQLINPQVIRFFLDTAESGGSQRALFGAALAFIFFALAFRLLTLLASITSQQVSWSATNRLRADLTLHCLRLDMPFHKVHTPGELIERIDGDVNQLANLFSQFVVQILGNALLVVGILILLFLEDIRVGAAMLVYTLLTLALLGSIQKLAVKRWGAARQAAADLYGFIEERISGVEDIRGVGGEPYVMRRLFERMRSYLEKVRASYVMGSITYNLTNLIYVLGYAAGLALGVFLYVQENATLGAAYLVVHYVGMLSMPLQEIRSQIQDFQSAAASVERIQAIFKIQPKVTETKGKPGGRLKSLQGALPVKFSNVSFHYDENENVLHNINFELGSGRVLGILGRTGSGKSTLVRLLFRLYDPSSGSIFLGSNDLRNIPLSDLRQRIGMVTQDVQLFHASIRDNLSFFDDRITSAHLQKVLQDLRLWDWIQAFPGGLDGSLSAGGQGLSAGEAQLLAFARVFLKDPGLVILDEASSRLDPLTETLIEHAVDRLLEERTGIIIAHRLKTVQRVDDILILENGFVVEYGERQVLAQDPASRFYNLLQTGLEEALA